MSDSSYQITLSTTADVVAGLPALVGYQPRNALVAVFLRGRYVACTACLPLPAGLDTARAQLARTGQLAAADGTFLAVYTPMQGNGLPRQGEVARLVEQLADCGLPVRDAVLVDDGRYWSYDSGVDPGRPDAGSEVPPGSTALEAARVAHGRLATAGSRAALAQHYQPCPRLAPSADVMRAAADVLALPVAQRCRMALDAACALAHRQTAGEPAAAQVLRARLTLLVEHDVLARDYLLCRVVTHPDRDTLVDAVVTTALTAAAQHRAPVAATAAALVAVQGDNPVAAWALLALAEDESLAGLVRDALRFGLPPDELREVFAGALDAVVARINAVS